MPLASRLRTPPVIAALVVACLTLVVTVAYATQRERAVFSTAQLVLVPTSDNADVRIQQLQTFNSSGVQGTFVEYLASQRAPGGTLEVRGVPDSRVIDVKMTRATEARRALDDVISTALARQSQTADDWAARQLGTSSAEQAAGPGTPVLLGAGALLALLAALATFTGIRALLASTRPAAPVAVAPPDEDAAAPERDAPPEAWPGPATGRSRSYAQLR